METIIANMRQSVDQAEIRRAADILKNGGLVAFPTETVYGLGGNALDAGASAKIYEAKGRPSDNPLIVHICDMQALDPIVREIPEAARRLADAFWPGPLTMIFKKTDLVPSATTGGLDTVAVRFPSHPVAQALMKAAGGYIAAPSANTSGRPSPTRAEHVIEDLSGKVEMIIDGGEVGIGLESSIIDLTEETPVILRPGFINKEMFSGVIGEVKTDVALLTNDPSVHPKAPGMKYRHYAPKAELTVVEGPQEDVCACICRMAKEAQEKGEKVGIIAAAETAAFYPQELVHVIGTRAHEETIAHNLYAVLRDFDECDTTKIFSEAFDTPSMGNAIMNRLMKAAGQRRIRAGRE